MRHRRFGRTEINMPVLTCGGMRYQQGWKDLPPSEITPESQENVERVIHRALELGMNHLETANGYGPSERQLGRVLRDIPREKFVLQTKVGPKADPKVFRQQCEESLQRLGVDRLDLFGFHGINDRETFDWTMRKGGCLEVAREFQRDGRFAHVGFSTHGLCDVIVKTLATGEFDYVNLHWYFINQFNWDAVLKAKQQDVGVFIISPTDKGGQLFKPPRKLVDLCRPLSPIAFNDLFCLSRPEVHTLSIGASRPEDFDEHIAALKHYENIPEVIQPIAERINEAMADALGADWWETWWKGVPPWYATPGNINAQYILRVWNWAKGMDMVDYGRYRYGMLGDGGSWMPGQNAGKADKLDFGKAFSESPFADRLPRVLREAHRLLSGKPGKPKAAH